MLDEMNTNLINKLTELNFTQDEASAYITLLKKSPMTGYNVALQSGIKKFHIYKVLESLIAKGCVEVSRGSTLQYIAIDYKIFFKRYLSMKSSIHDEILLEHKRLQQEKRNEDVMFHLYRKQDVYAQLADLIDASEKNIMLKIKNEDIKSLENSLTKAARRGIKLYILVMGEYENSNFEFYSYSSSSVCGENHKTIKAEFDEKTVFCCGIDNSNQYYATWTQSPLLVMPVQASLCMDISVSQLYKKHSAHERELYGDDFINLKRKFL